MQCTAATRSVSGGSFGNLNEGLLGDETLVAYAAAAGTSAVDPLEKLQELDGPMPAMQGTDDLAGLHVQGGTPTCSTCLPVMRRGVLGRVRRPKPSIQCESG